MLNSILFYVAQDEREVLPPNSEITGAANAAAASSHGIEVAGEFKPVEHPNEPLDNDRPIQCPLPEPSILNVIQYLGLLSRFVFASIVFFLFFNFRDNLFMFMVSDTYESVRVSSFYFPNCNN